MISESIKLCECGCGTSVRNRFAPYHHTRMEEYRKRHSEAVKGNKNMLGKTHSIETRAKIAEAVKRKVWTEEARKKISNWSKGNKFRVGCKLSEEHKEKIRQWTSSHPLSEESRKKISIAKMGNKCSLGAKRSEEFKRNMSLTRSGPNNPLFGIRGKDNPLFGRKISEEIRKKQSIAQIDYIIRNGHKTNRGIKGTFHSNKNKKEIKYESSFERKAFELLEEIPSVLSYDRCKFSIAYEFEGSRRYIPDIRAILINSVKIIEVKPEYALNDPVNKAKFAIAKEYCKKKGWEFILWTEKELFVPEEYRKIVHQLQKEAGLRQKMKENTGFDIPEIE